MNNLKHGTKVQMLNDCVCDHFKTGDILTIDLRFQEGYNCIETFKDDGGSPKYINVNYDKFRIIGLEVFETLGD